MRTATRKPALTRSVRSTVAATQAFSPFRSISSRLFSLISSSMVSSAPRRAASRPRMQVSVQSTERWAVSLPKLPAEHVLVEGGDVALAPAVVKVGDRAAAVMLRAAADVGLAPVGQPGGGLAALDRAFQRPLLEPIVRRAAGALVVPGQAVGEGVGDEIRVQRIAVRILAAAAAAA